MTRPVNLIVICGPTASGKTRLGVELALQVEGEILSVDSRQVYRGMDIGTGKDLEEYETPAGRVPYHLIDIADPREIYTLWQYQEDFYRIFAEIGARGRMPVAVGGTGLYLEAVLRDYRIPDVPEDPGLRRELMERPLEELVEELCNEDRQVYERTDRTSKKRVVRALEIAFYGRENLLRWGHDDTPDIRPLVIGVRWPREKLRERIEERLDRRLRQGMVDEVRRLMVEGIDRERLEMFGMEYRHIARFLCGQVDEEGMRADLLRDIGRLAKRQETYFRGMERRGTEIHWVDEARCDRARRIVEERLNST